MATVLGVGCADPEGEFKDFASRCQDQINENRDVPENEKTVCDQRLGGGGDRVCNPDVTCEEPTSAADGRYLLAISPVIATIRPILLEANITVTDEGVLFDLQPVAAFDQPAQDIEARQTLVGDPFQVGPVPVTGGVFEEQFPVLTVVGDANPVTVGAQIVAEVKLSSCLETSGGDPAGGFCGDQDFYCGIAEGAVTNPTQLDLLGSTWTLEKTPEGTPFRDPPYINCAMEEAGPPPEPP